MELTKIICLAVIVILTAIFIAWKIYKQGLRKVAIDLIVNAEDIYKKGDNQKKLNYVIDRLIALIPAPFSFFITRECIKNFIQKVFDEIKKALDYREE